MKTLLKGTASPVPQLGDLHLRLLRSCFGLLQLLREAAKRGAELDPFAGPGVIGRYIMEN